MSEPEHQSPGYSDETDELASAMTPKTILLMHLRVDREELMIGVKRKEKMAPPHSSVVGVSRAAQRRHQ